MGKSDGGTPLTGYVIERREEGMHSWMYCGRTDAAVMHYTCAGLYEKREYYFRVYAENKIGRSKPLDSDVAIIPKRIFEYSGCAWFKEVGLEPNIDVYLTQDVRRYEYMYRLYADNPLSCVYDTIDLTVEHLKRRFS